ncbi:MAG: hypothetical protein V3574_04345 [Candidatus Moraniibacteriota bacterium]
MNQLQLLFDETLRIEKDKKYKMQDFKELIKGDVDYQNIKEQIKELRNKVKSIEEKYLNDCGIEIEDINKEITGNKEMLSDIAISQLMDKGKIESITDDFGREYEPVIKVSFKKAKK